MICPGRVDLRMHGGMRRSMSWRCPLLYFPQYCTDFQFTFLSQVWQGVKKQPPTLPHTHSSLFLPYLWSGMSENEISFSICCVAVLLICSAIRLFRLGTLKTHFFPMWRSQSSKICGSLRCKLLLWFRAIIGTKDVCSALSTAALHTHMHSPTHLSFLTLLYVRRVNGVIQESEVLALLRLTLSILAPSDTECARILINLTIGKR